MHVQATLQAIRSSGGRCRAGKSTLRPPILSRLYSKRYSAAVAGCLPRIFKKWSTSSVAGCSRSTTSLFCFLPFATFFESSTISIMSAHVDVPRTFGALLLGGIIAAVFSGIVTAQTFAYFKFYTNDSAGTKALVSAVWVLDVCHMVFISAALWDHLIAHFGDVGRISYIPWSMALTIAFTAILTFLVHQFFVYRIYRLSKKRFLVAGSIAFLSFARLCFACLTTATMIKLQSLPLFVQQYTWSFTIGLTLSAVIDVLITTFMCYYLKKSHKADSSLNHILDTLMLYAFENGSLTCAGTFISLLCWLIMPSNLIFMGLHFVISKLYANSFLATLNTRKHLQSTGHHSQASGSGGGVAIIFPDAFGYRSSVRRNSAIPQMKITVQQTQVSMCDNLEIAPDISTKGSAISTKGGAAEV
ncbi:hypothetical protein BJ912DRAFT_972757 [Pholiota molesta]|nr:hypothetical protein BJ912DRAFT_972757 [Pholiota molesta]